MSSQSAERPAYPGICEFCNAEVAKNKMTQHLKFCKQSLLDELEDRSMGVSLARALKVGQKFSYIYDYGSSTYVQLTVIAEREGIVQNKREPVQLLAQNIAPTFVAQYAENQQHISP